MQDLIQQWGGSQSEMVMVEGDVSTQERIRHAAAHTPEHPKTVHEVPTIGLFHTCLGAYQFVTEDQQDKSQNPMMGES